MAPSLDMVLPAGTAPAFPHYQYGVLLLYYGSMVPAERIELPTFGLQNRCSTAELCRLKFGGGYRNRTDNSAVQRQRVPTSTNPPILSIHYRKLTLLPAGLVTNPPSGLHQLVALAIGSICVLSHVFLLYWSRWQDSNLRPPAPKAGAIPDFATPRYSFQTSCSIPCYFLIVSMYLDACQLIKSKSGIK